MYFIVNRVNDVVVAGPFSNGPSALEHQTHPVAPTRAVRPDVYELQCKQGRVLYDDSGFARVGVKFPRQPTDSHTR